MGKHTHRKMIVGMAIACLVCSAQAISLTRASAADSFVLTEYLTNEFMMDKGASVRLKSETKEITNEDGTVTTQTVETNGLRFSSSISTQAETALSALSGVKYGVIIAPVSAVTDAKGALNAENIFGDNPTYDVWESGETYNSEMVYNITASLKNVDDDAELEIAGSIVNLQTWNILRDYVGRAYVAIPNNTADVETTYTYYFAKYFSDETEYVESSAIKNNTRCMYYVAQKGIENGESASALQEKYIDVYNKYDHDGNGTYVVDEYTFPYTVTHHYMKDGEEIKSTQTQEKGKLGSVVQGVALENETVGDVVYVFDETTTGNGDSSYLYPSNLTEIHLYYIAQDAYELAQKATKEVFNAISNETGYETTYFGDTISVSTDSSGNPTLNSENDSGLGALTGQDALEFTPAFIQKIIDAGYSKLYIEKAVIEIGVGSSIVEIFGGNDNIVVDTIEVSGYVTQTLDASLVGYEATTSEGWLGFTTATITFTGITIDLSDAVNENANLVLAAYAGGNQISGTWTLTGLLFG